MSFDSITGAHKHNTTHNHESTITTTSLPDNTEGAIADGPIRLHFRGAWHLAGRVAVGLRYRCPAAAAARAPSQGGRVARRPRRGRGSGQARRGAQARGRGSGGRVDAEVLVAQLGGREQVPTDRLSACPVEGHGPL